MSDGLISSSSLSTISSSTSFRRCSAKPSSLCSSTSAELPINEELVRFFSGAKVIVLYSGQQEAYVDVV